MDVELNAEEVRALVSLARYVMKADGRITQAEVAAMKGIARHVGLVAFSDALEQTSIMAPLSGTEILRHCRVLKGEEKHIFAFRELAELAASDGIAEPEMTLLNALAAEWGLEWEAE